MDRGKDAIMDRLLEYNDVLIKPIPSSVNSREGVSTSTSLPTNGKRVLRLGMPIIASPMKGIVGVNLIKELGELGGIGILHRFYKSQEERLSDLFELEASGVDYGIAIRLNHATDVPILDSIYSKELTPKILCIDTANGYIKQLRDYAQYISGELIKQDVILSLMAGNVVSFEGVHGLSVNGVALSRIGIGSGQLCTTRNKAGIGYPQLSALQELKGKWWGLIADGGIKTTADIVKALGAGADAVMLGSMFAKTFESDNNGQIYGMASQELQDEFYGSYKSIEGISRKVEKTMPLKTLVDDISWSIRSACTYVNANNLAQLRKNTTFVYVGSHSIVEKEDVYVPN